MKWLRMKIALRLWVLIIIVRDVKVARERQKKKAIFLWSQFFIFFLLQKSSNLRIHGSVSAEPFVCDSNWCLWQMFLYVFSCHRMGTCWAIQITKAIFINHKSKQILKLVHEKIMFVLYFFFFSYIFFILKRMSNGFVYIWFVLYHNILTFRSDAFRKEKKRKKNIFQSNTLGILSVQVPS